VLAAACAVPLVAASAPLQSAVPLPAPAARNDYLRPAFTAPLAEGLRAFYARDFPGARRGFESALAVVPDNTLALSFLNAAAAHVPSDLDALINAEEDALGGAPKNYANHVRLGFSYMFASVSGRDRAQDAREELRAQPVRALT